ncbi:MAG: DUF1223 domain-containing protein [Bacteroidetes bacterium]|nr:DUF1223 domain-containing protein [Bacteroidota bacterium]
MRIISVVLFFFFSTANFVNAQNTGSGAVVVELFTSQGDINSPQADRLLSEIIADAEKNNKPVYCISMHVDFWNRFGWKDPFSSMIYTRRLTNYTSILKEKETFTPYIIINGTKSVAGTDSKKVLSTIESELKIPTFVQPDFSYTIFDDTLDITYDSHLKSVSGKAGNDKYIYVAVVEKGLSTKVTKGDNIGKTLINDNVSRLFFTTDLKSSKGLVRVPLKKIKPGVNKSIIFLFRKKQPEKYSEPLPRNLVISKQSPYNLLLRTFYCLLPLPLPLPLPPENQPLTQSLFFLSLHLRSWL